MREKCLVTPVRRNGSCAASYDSFLAGSSAVLRLNFCAKNPPPSPNAEPLATSVENDNL